MPELHSTRILVADHSAQPGNFTTAVSREEVLRATTEKFDVIISGSITGFDSPLAALDMLLQSFPAVPVIALAETVAAGEEAIRHGASDVILREEWNGDVNHRLLFVISRARYLQEHESSLHFSREKIAKVASSLAHDVRNSLTSLTLSIDRLAESCSQDEEAGFYLDMITRAGEKVNQSVSRFSIATGRIVLRSEPQDLAHIVRDVVEKFNAQYSKKGSISETIESSPIMANVDSDRIDLLLQNLFFNAQQSGAKSISVSLRHEGKEAVLRVRDNGHGMSEEVKQHAFEPFFSTRNDHLGFGLTIAEKIVKAHGGMLELHDVEGGGTEVVCRFPMDS